MGSKARFRISPEDAEFMQKQYEPVFTATDIMKLENREAYMAMLHKGQPVNHLTFVISADNPPSNPRLFHYLKNPISSLWS